MRHILIVISREHYGVPGAFVIKGTSDQNPEDYRPFLDQVISTYRDTAPIGGKNYEMTYPTESKFLKERGLLSLRVEFIPDDRLFVDDIIRNIYRFNTAASGRKTRSFPWPSKQQAEPECGSLALDFFCATS